MGWVAVASGISWLEGEEADGAMEGFDLAGSSSVGRHQP